MKTAKEAWEDICAAYQCPDVGMVETVAAIQLDARADLEKELEQVKQDRDEWKQLAELFHVQSEHHDTCKGVCTCGPTQLRAEFDRKEQSK